MTNSIPFEPASGRILVFPDPPKKDEELTESGLILLDQNVGAPVSSGRVVAVYDDTFDWEYVLQDRVVYSPYSGFSMSIGGVLYILLVESEILGKYTSDEVAGYVR